MVHLSSPVGLPDCLPEHLNDCDLGLFYLFFSGCLQAWCAACECQVCTPYAGWCAGFPLTNMCLPCLLSPPVCLPNLQALSLSWSPPHFVILSSYISLSLTLIQSVHLFQGYLWGVKTRKQIQRHYIFMAKINFQSRHIFQSLTEREEIMFDRLCNFLWCFQQIYGTLNYSS